MPPTGDLIAGQVQPSNLSDDSRCDSNGTERTSGGRPPRRRRQFAFDECNAGGSVVFSQNHIYMETGLGRSSIKLSKMFRWEKECGSPLQYRRSDLFAQPRANSGMMQTALHTRKRREVVEEYSDD